MSQPYPPSLLFSSAAQVFRLLLLEHLPIDSVVVVREKLGQAAGQLCSLQGLVPPRP